MDGRREERSSVNRQEVAAVLEIVQSITRCRLGRRSTFDRDRQPVSRPCRRCPRPADQDSCRPAYFERHAIVVGTAHALQGDEKDIVILSTSIDADSHPASLRFLENPNLFNVAITRARRQTDCRDIGVDGRLAGGLLREFLAYATAPWTPHLTWMKQAVHSNGRSLSDCGNGVSNCGPAFWRQASASMWWPAETDGQVAVLCDGVVGHREPPIRHAAGATSTRPRRLARSSHPRSHLAVRLVRLLRTDRAGLKTRHSTRNETGHC